MFHWYVSTRFVRKQHQSMVRYMYYGYLMQVFKIQYNGLDSLSHSCILIRTQSSYTSHSHIPFLQPESIFESIRPLGRTPIAKTRFRNASKGIEVPSCPYSLYTSIETCIKHDDYNFLCYHRWLVNLYRYHILRKVQGPPDIVPCPQLQVVYTPGTCTCACKVARAPSSRGPNTLLFYRGPSVKGIRVLSRK